MDISQLKRDVTSIEAGEWVTEIPGMGSLRLRVRGVSSKLYTAKLARLSRAVTREERDRANNLLPAASVRVMGEAAHEVLLIEWDGLESDGAPFPYDSETAKTWLTDPAFSSFLDAVMWAANVVDNGTVAKKEAAVKN